MPDNYYLNNFGGQTELTEWEMADSNELGNLEDLELKPQALKSFYDASAKMVLSEDPRKVWALYEEASDNLNSLFSRSTFWKNDFILMDFLLKRRAWRRMKELGAEVPQLKSVDFMLTKEELAEFDSSMDKSSLPVVKELFISIVKKMEMVPKEELMSAYKDGCDDIFKIYRETDYPNKDCSKLMYFLALRLKDIVGKKQGGVEK